MASVLMVEPAPTEVSLQLPSTRRGIPYPQIPLFPHQSPARLDPVIDLRKTPPKQARVAMAAKVSPSLEAPLNPKAPRPGDAKGLPGPAQSRGEGRNRRPGKGRGLSSSMKSSQEEAYERLNSVPERGCPPLFRENLPSPFFHFWGDFRGSWAECDVSGDVIPVRPSPGDLRAREGPKPKVVYRKEEESCSESVWE
jgi:hypothetical protein